VYDEFTAFAGGIIPKCLHLLPLIEWLRFCYRHPGRILLAMEMRKHPLMSYRGRPNWPPRWVWLGGKRNERPTGEVGILKEVSRYSLLSSDGLTLVIDYNESAYMGLLLFDNFGFARKLHDLLRTLRDRSIAEIGSFDIEI